jgi:hypothetical protein
MKTQKEAEFVKAYDAYMAARPLFYEGKVSAKEFVNLQNDMKSKSDWHKS